ncbi:MAG: hypothetical protein HY655_08185 [Acidobacteria bacterium]|nr:hypothetical protein [Acidobacteriota bacterium]
MMWLEQVSANRALTAAGWLGTALVVQSWRIPFAAIAAAVGKRRAARVRMAPVSSAWLREYEADCAKHDDAR